MTQTSDRLVIAFSSIGHFVVHLLIGLFLTLVIAIERTWATSYDELIALWTVGALLLGAGAPAAGWLADRVGEARMMVLFFVGAGASCVFAAFAGSTLQLQSALALLGLFGAIYHPVGMAWVVRHARSRGTTMGLLGISGSFGVAGAGIVAGFISDLNGWRMAFALPGIITIGLGVLLAVALVTGRIQTRVADASPEPEAGRADRITAFAVLAVTMFCGSIFYTAFTTAMPKWLDTEIGSVLPGDLLGLGAIVASIYLIGSLAQVVGGRLSDSLPLKWLYVASFAIKAPLLALAIVIGGWTVVPLAILLVFLIDLGAPVENLLLARYSPKRHRGLSYGIKHAMGLIAAPLGVQLVAFGYGTAASFTLLFSVLALLLGAMLAASLFLPQEQSRGRFSRVSTAKAA